jgi:hypothetical protein
MAGSPGMREEPIGTRPESGAIFSAGADCCAPGARSGDVTPWANAGSAISNAAADSNNTRFMDFVLYPDVTDMFPMLGGAVDPLEPTLGHGRGSGEGLCYLRRFLWQEPAP